MSYTPSMRYWIKQQDKIKIIELYNQGHSAREIKELMNLTVNERSIQRLVKSVGISRTVKEAFKIAVKKGRVTYNRNPNKIIRHKMPLTLRSRILARDNYKCVLCGATAQTTRLEVDHIDNDKNNNSFTNLQVLCEECNKGKYWLSKRHQG